MIREVLHGEALQARLLLPRGQILLPAEQSLRAIRLVSPTHVITNEMKDHIACPIPESKPPEEDIVRLQSIDIKILRKPLRIILGCGETASQPSPCNTIQKKTRISS